MPWGIAPTAYWYLHRLCGTAGSPNLRVLHLISQSTASPLPAPSRPVACTVAPLCLHRRARSPISANRPCGRGMEDAVHPTAPCAMFAAGGSSQADARPAEPEWEIAPHEWYYRVEGGRHLIFEYVGPQARLRGKILRVRSMKRFGLEPAPTFPLCDEAAAELALSRTALRPFMVAGDRLVLDSDTAYGLGELAQSFRPLKRKMRTEIPHRPAAAMLQDDLARLFGDDTVCVEVKPKSAVVSRSRLVRPEDCVVLEKFAKSDTWIREISRLTIDVDEHEGDFYHPGDLLSDEESRVAGAFEALRVMKSRWLRVLKGGVLFATTEFILNRGVSTYMAYDEPYCVHVLQVAAAALARHSVCGRVLLRLQHLDYLDRAGAELVWRRLVSVVGAVGAAQMVWARYLPDGRLEEGEGAGRGAEFRMWRDRICYPDSATAARIHSESEYSAAVAAVNAMPPPVCAQMVADFMTAAAAKDCSLLVAMAPTQSAGVRAAGWQGQTVRDASGEEWAAGVHAIHLAPKSLAKITWWAENDRRLADEARTRLDRMHSG